MYPVTHPDSFIELSLVLVIIAAVEGVASNVVVSHLVSDLQAHRINKEKDISVTRMRDNNPLRQLTVSLNLILSSRVMLSALAITGTTLTTSASFFMTMISSGLRE